MGNRDKCTTCIPSDIPFDYINAPGAKQPEMLVLSIFLSFLKGEKGIVETLSETDRDLEHQIKIGQKPAFVKRLEVSVLAKSPNNRPVIIKVGDDLCDVCNDVASVVWVKPNTVQIGIIS
ncbi:MAG: ferrous iron transport protein A [Deltaproteobacteria bacterium]|nr:ferrous iron transport protein A [Deltaproteobacteria bacterium]